MSKSKVVNGVVAGAIAVLAMGCAATPIRVSPRIVADRAALPDNVALEALETDAACSSRETVLVMDHQKGKEEQEDFKTIMGSITGSVGTAGGAVAGIGAFVASPEDLKAMTAVTGFVSGGLGAIGTVITAVVSPGKAKMETSRTQLETLEKKKAAARAALSGKAAGSWSEDDAQTWAAARKDLADICK